MTSILLPPGIGDGYWVATKLAGFFEREGIHDAVAYVDGMIPRRSEGMWRRVPCVEWGDYTTITQEMRRELIFKRAYYDGKYTVQRGVFGFDYFISLNGALRRGRTIDDGLPGVKTDWYGCIASSTVEDTARERFRLWDPYVVVAFWDRGNYKYWLKDFPEQQIVQTLDLIKRAGYDVVVMGAEYDRGTIAERIANRYVDMLGDTSFDEMMALLSCARGVFGFPAGNTLLGPYHKVPTLLLWNRFFHRGMWNNCTPPGGTHVAIDTRGARPFLVASQLKRMIDDDDRTLP